MNLSISHYGPGNQELSYQLFACTPDGLRAAKAVLAIKNAPQFHHGITPSQFESPWDEQIEQAYKLLKEEDVDGLAKHLEECHPRI